MNQPASYDSTLLAILYKLDALGIRGTVVAIKNGPVLSTAIFMPAADVRVAKVQKAAVDLSMVAHGPVRVFPIPGQGVGIEYPNPVRQTTSWMSLIWSPAIRMIPLDRQPLTVPLGVDTSGDPLIVDLELLPHLLIAGATGSGKSTALHSIIMSLMIRNSNDTLHFVMIDPKGVELQPYRYGLNGGQHRGIPHIVGFATDQTSALDMLNRVAAEVERRYQLMARAGVRQARDLGLASLVVVIDELADLMQGRMKKAFEQVIGKIAQKARAASVHLIVATQRPSVDVVSGVIKANLPARLCFRLPTGHDSRTVIDQGGAEELYGNGDGLFMGSGIQLMRLQCPLVTDDDIAKVVAGAIWYEPPSQWSRFKKWWGGSAQRGGGELKYEPVQVNSRAARRQLSYDNRQ